MCLFQIPHDLFNQGSRNTALLKKISDVCDLSKHKSLIYCMFFMSTVQMVIFTRNTFFFFLFPHYSFYAKKNLKIAKILYLCFVGVSLVVSWM